VRLQKGTKKRKKQKPKKGDFYVSPAVPCGGVATRETSGAKANEGRAFGSGFWVCFAVSSCLEYRGIKSAKEKIEKTPYPSAFGAISTGLCFRLPELL